MKLKQWLYGATALAMLAACSDKDLAPDTGGGENEKFETVSGEGYLGITLQLPEQPATRALEDNHANDRYDDGLPTEYNVKNAALLLFWGPKNNEAAAEFVGAYKIGSDERFDMPNGDNITTSFQNVATLNKKFTTSTTNQLWGLALVNYDDTQFIIGGGTDTSSANYGTLTIAPSIKKINPDDETLAAAPTTVTIKIPGDATNPAGTPGMKFSDFRNLITEDVLYKPDGNGLNIFMTNAPLCDHIGGDVNPGIDDNDYKILTLAELDASKIYENRETAKVNPAGCIFVERAVAKITLGEFPLTATLKYQELTQTDDGTITSVGTDAADVTLKIVSLGWMVDNEETSSYVIRNAKKGALIGATGDEDIWNMGHRGKYRFVGSQSMAYKIPDGSTYDENTTFHNKYFRTYWCRDPHYINDKPSNVQATTQATYTNLLDDDGNLITSGAFYPRENTFSLQNQNYQNTTRVVFKVQYEWTDAAGNALNVYCKAGDPSIIYKRTDAQKFLKEAVITSGTIHDFILKYVDGATAVTKNVATKNADGTYNITYGIDDFDWVFQTVATEDNGKLYQITGLSLKDNGISQSLKLPEDEAVDADGKPLTEAQKAQKLEAAKTAVFNSAKNNANEDVLIRSFADLNTENNNANICYYAVNIQHFGDTYCPMPAGYTGTTTDKVYGTDKAAYLGRWGLVRNNWYELAINAIKTMGFADVPSVEGNKTSDDNNKEEYYLSARVHILSWAKRTQTHTF